MVRSDDYARKHYHRVLQWVRTDNKREKLIFPFINSIADYRWLKGIIYHKSPMLGITPCPA